MLKISAIFGPIPSTFFKSSAFVEVAFLGATAFFTNIDYAFIKSIDIQLYDVVNGTVKSIPAFYRDPVPKNTGEIVDLVTEELNLKEFLLKDKINIRIKLQLFESAPKTVESRLILKFAVR